MLISLACPAPVQSRKGNRVTANRWADILVALGHDILFSREDPSGAAVLPSRVIAALSVTNGVPARRCRR